MSDHSAATGTRQLSNYLWGIIALAALMYLGRTLFIPMSFGLLVAIVMYPASRWLERRGMSRTLAVTLSISVVVVLFALLVLLLVLELQAFTNELPELRRLFASMLPDLQLWVSRSLDITTEKQAAWLHDAFNGQGMGGSLRSTLSSVSSTVFLLFMVPIFGALFLYHRGTFVRFISTITRGRLHDKLRDILTETVMTYSRFIKGMVMVYIIVGVLNSAGLMALGIRNAVLFGMLTAIMTIIPYVGLAK